MKGMRYKEKMEKLKKKSKKKLIIISIVLLIIIIAIVIIFKPKEVEKQTIQMEKISKKDIAKSISASGIISTSDTKNFVSTLSGLKIVSVNVKEGDKIAVGDTICTFDTSSISENLASLNKSVNAANAQGNLSIQGAKRGLNDAIANRDKQVSASQSDVDKALKTYQDAQNALNQAKNELATKQANFKNAEKVFNQMTPNYNNVKKQYTTLETVLNQAKNNYDAKKASFSNAEIAYKQYFDESGNPIDPNNNMQEIKNAYNQAKTELQSAEISLNTANTNYSSYKSIYEQETAKYIPVQNNYQTLSAAVASAVENVKSLEINVNQLKNTYEGTVNAYNTTASVANSQVSSMQDTLSGAEISSSIAGESQNMQIREYQKKLEEGTLKSTVSGTVTKVNVKPGDIYTGSAIATVEGVEEFIIEAEIDEYDIADIKEGMKVLIKTDATREDELEGRVIYTAASATNSVTTATSSATMGATSSIKGGNATYNIKIALDTQNDRLRLGMNAKLSIITEMKENVWAVPYDSVHTREDGGKYIEIAKNQSGEEKEQIDVKTGIEGSYYIEIISDKLKEGMKVIIPEIDSGSSVEELIEMMGANAGI